MSLSLADQSLNHVAPFVLHPIWRVQCVWTMGFSCPSMVSVCTSQTQDHWPNRPSSLPFKVDTGSLTLLRSTGWVQYLSHLWVYLLVWCSYLYICNPVCVCVCGWFVDLCKSVLLNGYWRGLKLPYLLSVCYADYITSVLLNLCVWQTLQIMWLEQKPEEEELEDEKDISCRKYDLPIIMKWSIVDIISTDNCNYRVELGWSLQERL